MSSVVVDLLRDRRIFTHARGANRLAIGGPLVFPLDLVIEPYAHLYAGDHLARRMGAFSYSHSACDPVLAIGRYCSIGSDVAVMGPEHPSDFISTSPFSYGSSPPPGFAAFCADTGATMRRRDFARPASHVVVGNDVWIAQDVLLRRNIAIGDGAIVAAGSVVVDDVPPYAVVGGDPAKVIRYRFGEDLVARLLRSRWWRFAPPAVQALDPTDAEGFVERLDRAIADGLAPLDLRPLTGAELVAAIESRKRDGA